MGSDLAGFPFHVGMRRGSWNGHGPSWMAASFRLKRRRCGRADEGGQGTKVMLVVKGKGIPLSVSVAQANTAEARLAEKILDRIRVPRKKGRSRKRPRRLAATKVYDSDRFRKWLRCRRINSCIPPRRNRRDQRKKWEAERTFAWLGNFKLRWNRYSMMCHAFFTLACLLICLRAPLK